MSDSKDSKKKGFFSRLFGGLSAPKETENEVTKPQDSAEIPTKSALNKMKKADIVDCSAGIMDIAKNPTIIGQRLLKLSTNT